MDQYFVDFLDRLQGLHEAIEKFIVDLPVEALNWVPGEEMNSIAVLVTHLAGAERFWLGDVAILDDSGRVRAEEFEVEGLDAQLLVARLREATAYAAQAMEQLSVADLAVERPLPSRNGTFTVGWSLLHALEHTAEHLGHIELTSQLWRQTQSA